MRVRYETSNIEKYAENRGYYNILFFFVIYSKDVGEQDEYIKNSITCHNFVRYETTNEYFQLFSSNEHSESKPS